MPSKIIPAAVLEKQKRIANGIAADIRGGMRHLGQKGEFLRGANFVYGALLNAARTNTHRVPLQVSAAWETRTKCTIEIHAENSMRLGHIIISKNSPVRVAATFGGKRISVAGLAEKIMSYRKFPAELMQ